MSNSRLKLMAQQEEKPTNSSKGKGLILETPYRPGFVDDKDLETVKMAVDKELSDISNAFYKTTERTADTITRIDKIEIEGDNLLAKIEEVDKVSKEGDAALAQRITTLTATVDDNTAKITQESTVRADADSALAERVDKLEAEVGDGIKALIEEEARVRADADGALAERITTLKAESESGDATLNQSMSVISDKTGKLEAKWGIQTNVNGKVAGIQLNNDGATSAFDVVADRFTISDGTNNTIPPFEVVGGNTRIKSAFINTLQSDNWDGAATGWAITRDGWAHFNNVTVRGTVYANAGNFTGTVNAQDGVFHNVRITGSCTYEGQITSNQIQDTAVTAIIKASNTIDVASGVGNAPIYGDIANFNITTPRPYDRVVSFEYPNTFHTSVSVNDRNKAYQVFVQLFYNGSLITQTEFVNASNAGGTNFNVERNDPCVISGPIPANTSGSCIVRLYLYLQDSSSQRLTCYSRTSTISIFKVSGELS